MTCTNTHQIDVEIRRLTAECPISRPFLCDGSPMGCEVALVGINPATDTPFWPHWSPHTGFDRPAWIQAYRSRHVGRHTPTRDRIEILVEAIKPLRLLELNLFQYPSRSERELERARRDTNLFEFLLQATSPRLLIAHGLSTKLHLEKLFNCKLPYDQLTPCSFNGARIYVLQAPKHLAYVPGGESYVRGLAARIKFALAELDAQRDPPEPPPKDVDVPISRRRIAGSAPSATRTAPHVNEVDPDESAALAALHRIPNDHPFFPAGGRGGPYTLQIRDAGRGMAVAFIRQSGGTKPMSIGRFLDFWRMWRRGTHELSAYRNQSGKGTRAAAASYALPVFEWIATHER